MPVRSLVDCFLVVGSQPQLARHCIDSSSQLTIQRNVAVLDLCRCIRLKGGPLQRFPLHLSLTFYHLSRYLVRNDLSSFTVTLSGYLSDGFVCQLGDPRLYTL